MFPQGYVDLAMHTAILIDDEQDALEVLKMTLKADFADEIKILGATTEFREGVLLVQEYQPDLLFLDIDLGEDKSGFDFLKAIGGMAKVPRVIFTTGYQQFAIRAVQVQAFDYLLKPVDTDDIAQMLLRLKEEEEKARPVKSPLRQGVIVRNSDAMYRIPLDEISCFEGNGNYTNVHWMDKPRPILASATLNQFEEEVFEISDQFFRVHKSYLVNLEEIERMEKSGLTRSLLLKNGARIPISRLRVKAFMKTYF